MRKALFLAFSLFGCYKMPYEGNCITGSACKDTEYCSGETETCKPLLLITDVTPAIGSQSASTMVTITGSGFTDSMTVQVGDLAASNVKVISPTQLTALFPESPGRCGATSVSAANPDGKMAIKAAAFRYSQGGSFSAAATHALMPSQTVDQLIVDDIDGDTFPDILTQGTNSLYICLGSSTGTFNCNYSVPNTSNNSFPRPNIMRLVDYNRDGKKSILIVGSGSKGTNGIFFADARGNTLAFSMPMSKQSFEMYSINDIIQVDHANKLLPVDLWLATATGVFSLPFGSNIGDMTAVQITSLQMSTIQLTQPDTNTLGTQLVGTLASGVAVLSHDIGAPSYSGPMFSSLPITKLRIADINGDSRPDLVGATSMGGEFYSSLGQEMGGFSVPSKQPDVTAASDAFEVADLDCSGSPGLVVLSSASSATTSKSFSYVKGHSDGTFTDPAVILSATDTVTSFTVKDVNSDGRPDIVYVAGGQLKVAINTIVAP